MTLPAITPLPPAPARSDAPNDFSAKADAFAAALPGLVNELNEAAGFIDQRAADAQQSAQAALNAVAVAGSAGGIPALAGNAGKVLRINAQENAVFWDTAAPPASSGTPGLVALATPQETADGLDSTRAVTPASLKPSLAGKQAAAANLNALAGLAALANQLPYFTGAGAMALAVLTTKARDLLASADTGAMQAVLGLGTAATRGVGTGAGQLVESQSVAQLYSLELRANGGTPFIDFSNDNLVDFDARLILTADDVLNVDGVGVNGLLVGGYRVFNAGNVTAFIQTLIDDTDALTARSTLGACGISGPVSQTLSGTAVDFTAIPSWAKRLRVGFNGASLNAATAIMAQLGTAAGIVSGGYGGAVAVTVNGGVSAVNLSTGVDLDNPSGPDASMVYSGLLEFEHMGGNVWAFKSTISRTDNTRQTSTSGAVALPGGLTTLRLTSHNGTASFDAGTASLTYEG